MSQFLAIIGAMKTSSLDILEKAQLQPAQAKAILQVMEMELAERDTRVATRADLDVLRESMRADFAEMREHVETKINRMFVGQMGIFAALVYFAVSRKSGH
ncbi:MAG TPA: hypothetical protein VFE31_03425 [Opitutaceae bacterium]|jgi:hypothetical protein|nr:hypothetical protein [Opitutaceae bacterium]